MTKPTYGRYQSTLQEQKEARAFLLKVGKGMLLFCLFYTIAVSIYWYFNPEARERFIEKQALEERLSSCQNISEDLEKARWNRDVMIPRYVMTPQGRSEWEQYNSRAKELQQRLEEQCSGFNLTPQQ